jgi:hypothetical protein
VIPRAHEIGAGELRPERAIRIQGDTVVAVFSHALSDDARERMGRQIPYRAVRREVRPSSTPPNSRFVTDHRAAEALPPGGALAVKKLS